MKNLVINYDFFNDNNVKIVLLSDLHDYPFRKNKDFLESVKSQEPDLFIVDGDLLQGNKYFSSESFGELKGFVDSLSESGPVFVKRGNHDLIGRDNLSEFKLLEKGKDGRVFAANNEIVEVSSKNGTNLLVADFTPSRKAFAPSGQDSGLAIKQAANDFANSGLPSTLPSGDKIKIVSLHNTKFWTMGMSLSKLKRLGVCTDEALQLASWLSQFDMATAGHLHNGYIPPKLISEDPGKYLDMGWWEMTIERDTDGNVSFVRPWVYKKTGDCRGAIYVGFGDKKIIQVSDGTFYDISIYDEPAKITKEQALELIVDNNLKPIFISGGVNKFFGLPFRFNQPEITTITSTGRSK